MTKKPGQSASQSPNRTLNDIGIGSNIAATPMSTTTSSKTDLAVNGDDPLALASRISYYTRDDVELGHMGFISHSADLLQHESQIDASFTDLNSGLHGFASTEGRAKTPLSESQLRIRRLGVAILECLPEEKFAARLYNFLGAEGQYLYNLGPSYVVFDRRFWDTYGVVFQRPHVATRMTRLADLLSHNTLKPLTFPRKNSEWLDSICDSNSRWELVGSCIVHMAVAIFNHDDGDPLLKDIIRGLAQTRRDYCCRLLEAADACYRLCTTELKQNNKLTVSLFISATWLQSMVGGDSSLSLHIRKGAALAAMTAFGMHEYREEEERSLPRAFIQDMRRIVGLMVTLDTILATFCGRPPGLSMRYVSCPMPWDISNEEVLDDSFPIENDPHSWNPSGEMSQTSRMRASLVGTRLRQEILELCLGPPQGDVGPIIDNIRAGLERSYQSLPACFHIELSREACGGRHHRDIACIYGTRLKYLHSHFLIARYEQTRGIQSRFLEVAQQMLSLINGYFNVRDRLPNSTDELHWNVCCYGIPAASALSIDLWKSKRSQSLSTSTARSQTILDLSVFISALEWIDPSAGNITLCRRAHRMIKHILDFVLAPPPAPDQDLDQIPQADPFDIGGMSLEAMPTFGIEFENFFENIDWDALPWESV